MKHNLHNFLTSILFFLAINSFAETKHSEDLVCPTASISYAGTPFCSSNSNPQSVTLTGTDAYLGGTFTSTMGLSINSATGAIMPSVSTEGTYVVSYTIPAGPGCPSTIVNTTIVITNQPNAGMDSNTTICDSSFSTINLFSLIVGEQSGGVWTRTSGFGGTFNAAAGTFTPAPGLTTSTFEYTLTGSASCNNDSSMATIFVNAQPYAGTDGNTSICESSSTINLFNLITGEQAGGVWTRTTGTGGTFNAVAGTFTPTVGSTTSTFIYTITGTTPCVNDLSVATININTIPTGISISGTTTTCAGVAVNLTATGTPGTVITLTDTQGNPNTFVIGASGTAIISVTPTISTTYSITSASNGACSIPVAGQSATVNINQQPNAGIDGNTTICESSSATIDLFSLITGEQAGGTWVRVVGTGGTFNAAAGTFTPSLPLSTSIFSYTLTGVSPCMDDTSLAIINITPQPIAGYDGQTSVSEADTTPIDLFSLITGEQAGGVWTQTSGTGGTFNAASGTYTAAIGATTSTFDYIMIGTAPCVNDSSTATINIDAVPVGVPSANNQTITNGNFSNITLSSSNVPGATFTWTVVANNINGASDGSGNVISQQLSLVDVNLDGYVDFTITPVNNSANGNPFTARVGILSILSAETFIKSNIKLSPNPFTDILNIENDYQINNVKIYNQLGQLVFGKEINQNTTQLDLSNLNSGIYNVLIETEKGTFNHKIVKK